MKTFAQTVGSLTNTKRHTLLGNKSLSFFSLPLSHTKRSIIYIWQHSYLEMYACVHVKLLQSCSTLRDPMDCSLPGSSVHGILQARILELVAMPYSRGSSNPEIEPTYLKSPTLAGRFFTTSATLEMYTKLHI